MGVHCHLQIEETGDSPCKGRVVEEGCIYGPDAAIFGGHALRVFPRSTTTPTRQCSPA